MPKKTRRQKKQAEKRRVAHPVLTLEIEKKLALPISNANLTVDHPKGETDNQLAWTTLNDLRKTLVLVSLLFALEIVIFYANLRGII